MRVSFLIVSNFFYKLVRSSRKFTNKKLVKWVRGAMDSIDVLGTFDVGSNPTAPRTFHCFLH